MRIAYLGQMADMAVENGISKKIRQQSLAWLQRGHSVHYFALTPSGVAWPGLAPLETTLLRRGGLLGRQASSRELCRRIRAWSPDLIYFRYANHEAGLPALLGDIPTIGEINSDDTYEYGLTLPLHKRLYHKLTRKSVLRKLTGLVPVTEELAHRMSWLGIPSQVIANSLDLAATPALPPLSDAAPSLLFIGNTGSPWHGLERIGELAEMLPDYRFDIVGCDQGDWQACSARPLHPNMVLHGTLGRDQYLHLVAGATAAIGTMALFRKSMDEACPLKVREYLCHGLPVIAAYRDTDIPDGANYFLRLPNTPSPLQPWREKIMEFLERWRGQRIPRTEIAHIDISVKEEKRLAFMARILSKTGGP